MRDVSNLTKKQLVKYHCQAPDPSSRYQAPNPSSGGEAMDIVSYDEVVETIQLKKKKQHRLQTRPYPATLPHQSTSQDRTHISSISPMSRPHRRTSHPHQSTSRAAQSQFSTRNAHPYSNCSSRSSSPTEPFSAPSHRKGKYYNGRRTAKNLAGIRPSSVRKDCEKMSGKDKDDDQNLVRNGSQNYARLHAC